MSGKLKQFQLFQASHLNSILRKKLMSDNSVNILDIKNIEVIYDNVILALHDVSLKVPNWELLKKRHVKLK